MRLLPRATWGLVTRTKHILLHYKPMTSRLSSPGDVKGTELKSAHDVQFLREVQDNLPLKRKDVSAVVRLTVHFLGEAENQALECTFAAG